MLLLFYNSLLMLQVYFSLNKKQNKIIYLIKHIRNHLDLHSKLENLQLFHQLLLLFQISYYKVHLQMHTFQFHNIYHKLYILVLASFQYAKFHFPHYCCLKLLTLHLRQCMYIHFYVGFHLLIILSSQHLLFNFYSYLLILIYFFKIISIYLRIFQINKLLGIF